MTVPSAATKAYLDAATDDPKLARAELADLVDKVNAIINHLGLSTILSTPLTIGTGLENNSGALQACAASDAQTGIVELATNAEALTGTDAARAVTPAALKHTLDNQPAPVSAASQAEQESASSTSVYVAPGRQQFHPSAAKCWVYWNGSGGATVLASYNITSVTRNTAGDYTVTIATDFSSANWAPIFTCGNGLRTPNVSGISGGGAVTVQSRDASTALADSSICSFVGFGDQ